MKIFSLLFFFVSIAGAISFADDLESKMLIETIPEVVVVQPRFEKSDAGQMQFRCRLETKNERHVNAVAHLLFEAINVVGEEEEVLWSKKKVVLRKQFSKRFGGRVGMFIREDLEGIPTDFQTLRISFVNSPSEK